MTIKLKELTHVGPKTAIALANAGIYSVKELLYFLPRSYQDRRTLSRFSKAALNTDFLFMGMIVKPYISYYKGGKKTFDMIVKDESGEVTLRFFHFNAAQVTHQFRKNQRISIFGKISEFAGKRLIIHPEIENIPVADQLSDQFVGRILPVYPKIAGIYPKVLRKIIAGSLIHKPPFPEVRIPAAFKVDSKIDTVFSALCYLHAPPPEADILLLKNKTSIAHKVVAVDELFYYHLALSMLREKWIASPSQPLAWDESLFARFCASLPFRLSPSQLAALAAIKNDLAQARPMVRMAMGDVGCGKTIVAVIASLMVAACGRDVAFLVPTILLVNQHSETFIRLLKDFDISVLQISANRDRVPPLSDEKLPANKTRGKIFIGTHALIGKDSILENVGLVIIDEQQRFGIMQRGALAKGKLSPHVLSLSATPIPRSMALKYLGCVDVSYLDNPPSLKRQVASRVFDSGKENLWTLISEYLTAGKKSVLVCPAISAGSKATTVKVMEKLQQHGLHTQAAVIHGEIENQKIQTILDDFKTGVLNLLIATTIVEVGLHIPDIDVMIVFSANQFGLSQLHQLRGRIGRDGRSASFVLIPSNNADEDSIERLRTFCELKDGFAVAEYDLELRGRGELFGKNQSGGWELDPSRLGNFPELEKEVFNIVQAMTHSNQQSPDKSAEISRYREMAAARWKGKLDLSLLA